MNWWTEHRRNMAQVRESGKFDRVGVAFKPFGGEPMICGVRDNKVTIL